MIWKHLDRVLTQNFDAVLAVIVIWAEEAIFEKCCQDAEKHILRHR